MPEYKYFPATLADRLGNMNFFSKSPVAGPRQGLHRSPLHGASVEFAEYREYMPGDPPSLIDWAVYARCDRYLIRKFHDETTLKAYILIDTSESLLFQDYSNLTKMEYAFSLAASIMYILLRQGDMAGIMTFDSNLKKIFEPVATLDAFGGLLTEMEYIHASGKSNIERSLHQAAQRIQGRHLVVVISDFLEESSSILKGIHHLCHNGLEVVLFQILDRSEICFPFEGILEIQELETKQKMVIDVKEIKDSYITQIEKHLYQLQHGAMECMADYYFIDTSTPIEQALNKSGIVFSKG